MASAPTQMRTGLTWFIRENDPELFERAGRVLEKVTGNDESLAESGFEKKAASGFDR